MIDREQSANFSLAPRQSFTLALGDDPDLDAFMQSYISELEALKDVLCRLPGEVDAELTVLTDQMDAVAAAAGLAPAWRERAAEYFAAPAGAPSESGQLLLGRLSRHLGSRFCPEH